LRLSSHKSRSHRAVGRRGALWSPTIRAAILADTPSLDAHCLGCNTKPRDRYPCARSGPAGHGRLAGDRLAVLDVSGLGADAGFHWIACGAASSDAKRDELMPRKPQPLLRWDIYRAAAKAL